jgi:hypothetical protein
MAKDNNHSNHKGNRLLAMPGMGSAMSNAKKAKAGRMGGAMGGMMGAKTRRENKAAGKMQTRLAKPL